MSNNGLVQFSLWDKKKENKLKGNAQNVLCLVGFFLYVVGQSNVLRQNPAKWAIDCKFGISFSLILFVPFEFRMKSVCRKKKIKNKKRKKRPSRVQVNKRVPL